MSLFNHCLETVGKKKERKKTREARKDLLVIADHLESNEEETGGLVDIARQSLGIPSDVSLEHFMTKPDVQAVLDPQVTVDDGEMALEQLGRLIEVSERDTYDRAKWYSEVSFAVNDMCAELDYPVECLRMGEHKSLRHNREAIEGVTGKAWGAVRQWWKNRLTTPNALFINKLSEDGPEVVTLSSRFTELGRIASEANEHRNKGTLGSDSVALARACASKGIFLTKQNPEEILETAFDTLLKNKSGVLSRLSRNITGSSTKTAEELSSELYASVAEGLDLAKSTSLASHLRVEEACSNGDWFFLEIVQTLNKGKCTLEHRHNNKDVADTINFNKLCKFAVEASSKYQYYTKGIERGSEDILAVISSLVDSDDTITQEMTEYTLGIIRYYDTHRECISNIITHMNDIISALDMVTHEVTAAPAPASDKPAMTTEELSHEVIDVESCYEYITAGVAVEFDNKNELMNEAENYNRAINACSDFSAEEVLHLEISQEELSSEGFFRGAKNLATRMWEALMRMFRMIRKKMMKFAYWITGNKYKSSKKAKGTALVKTADAGSAFSGSTTSNVNGDGNTSDFTYDGHYSEVDDSAGSGGKRAEKAKKKQEKEEARANLDEDNSNEDKNGKVFGERTGDEEVKHQKQEKKERKRTIEDDEEDARNEWIARSKAELAAGRAVRAELREKEKKELNKVIRARNLADSADIKALQEEVRAKMNAYDSNVRGDRGTYRKERERSLKAEREFLSTVDEFKAEQEVTLSDIYASISESTSILKELNDEQTEKDAVVAEKAEEEVRLNSFADDVADKLEAHIKETAKAEKVEAKEATKAATKINKTNMDISELLIKHQKEAVRVEGFETEKESRKRLRNNKREIVRERKNNERLVGTESKRVTKARNRRLKLAVREEAIKQKAYELREQKKRLREEVEAAELDAEFNTEKLKAAEIALLKEKDAAAKAKRESEQAIKVLTNKARARYEAKVEHAADPEVKAVDLKEATDLIEEEIDKMQKAMDDRVKREAKEAKKAKKKEEKLEKARIREDKLAAQKNINDAMSDWNSNMRKENKRLDEVAARAIEEAYANEKVLKAKKKKDKIEKVKADKKTSDARNARAAMKREALAENSKKASFAVFENQQAHYFPMYDGASTINIREPLALYRFLVGAYRDTLEGIYKNLEHQRAAVGQWALEEARYIRDGARNSIGTAHKPPVMSGGLANIITGRNTFINTYVLGDYKNLNLRKEQIMVPMTSRDLDKYENESHEERPLRMGISPDADDIPMLNVKTLIDAINKVEKMGRKVNIPYDLKEATEGLRVCFEAQLAASNLERFRVECIGDNMINTLEFIEKVEAERKK